MDSSASIGVQVATVSRSAPFGEYWVELDFRSPRRPRMPHLRRMSVCVGLRDTGSHASSIRPLRDFRSPRRPEPFGSRNRQNPTFAEVGARLTDPNEIQHKPQDLSDCKPVRPRYARRSEARMAETTSAEPSSTAFRQGTQRCFEYAIYNDNPIASDSTSPVAVATAKTPGILDPQSKTNRRSQTASPVAAATRTISHNSRLTRD